MRFGKQEWRAARLGAAVLTAMLALSQAQAAPGRSKLVPPQAKPHGQTLGEWGAQWWQWAVSTPAAINPMTDPDGRFCSVGQQDHVWFLAGTLGTEVVRSCTVPFGTMLFFPLVNSLWWAPDDLPAAKDLATFYGLDPEEMTDAELLQLGNEMQMGGVKTLVLEIDGEPVEGLFDYRAQTPVFAAELGDVYIPFGYQPGERDPSVGDGYWVMLQPLPPGSHTIHFHASFELSVEDGDPYDYAFSLDVAYNLTVAK